MSDQTFRIDLSDITLSEDEILSDLQYPARPQVVARPAADGAERR